MAAAAAAAGKVVRTPEEHWGVIAGRMARAWGGGRGGGVSVCRRTDVVVPLIWTGTLLLGHRGYKCKDTGRPYWTQVGVQEQEQVRLQFLPINQLVDFINGTSLTHATYRPFIFTTSRPAGYDTNCVGQDIFIVKVYKKDSFTIKQPGHPAAVLREDEVRL